MAVLLLGGTVEARELATRLVADGVPVVTSLAGEVTDLRRPPGEVRVGGFGGVDGLARYLRDHPIAALVDATHPFAVRMTANAAAACQATGVPLLRLERPSWSARPDAASWHWVDTVAAAREAADRLGERVFLAVGRHSLAEFAGWTDRSVLARVIDPPEVEVPSTWEVLRARGPFTLADEVTLLRDHAIDVLVTKDSGGPTDAKLDAAGRLAIPVVCLRRPSAPPGLDVVDRVGPVLDWLTAQRRRSR
ncbi:MAG: cobalt-precorrin-6A reductase [Propioniciclava sp.]